MVQDATSQRDCSRTQNDPELSLHADRRKCAAGALGLLEQPDSWKYQANRAAASSILSTVYDLPSIQSPDHPSITFMDEFIDRTTAAALPGSHLANVFFVLDYLPDYMSKWRTRAQNDFKRYTRTFHMFLKNQDQE
ncbi:hypothetical protein D9758_002871 [Tetrapyrgos nigripes]|uniref:Uncharacterized protein n=1 Tax=Tetrapyrgos nigripes TaxID=182062 RepID=A0A8H5GQF6_9AGAR|nr:hypothetical protein D9758_002871 [Tetrapyrgos nigripes]